MDPREATRLEEIDMLRVANINLRVLFTESELAKLKAEREALQQALVTKYGAEGDQTLTVKDDGTIVRPPAPPALVSLPSEQ